MGQNMSVCDSNNVPDLPKYKGDHNITHPSKLMFYDPPVGSEYGFNNFGLRFDVDYLDSLVGKEWNSLEELSIYVDAITWMNCDNEDI